MGDLFKLLLQSSVLHNGCVFLQSSTLAGWQANSQPSELAMYRGTTLDVCCLSQA
jgi:hypothetical protein